MTAHKQEEKEAVVLTLYPRHDGTNEDKHLTLLHANKRNKQNRDGLNICACGYVEMTLLVLGIVNLNWVFLAFLM